MSGPIIRKYGFPNFEGIFGKETPKHGVDDPPAETPAAETPAIGKQGDPDAKPADDAKPGVSPPGR